MGLQLAWIGLGNMGRAMAANLVQKGNLDAPLIVYNRTMSRADELATELGPSNVTVAKIIEDVIKAGDVIFTMLSNDAALKETMEQVSKMDIAGKIFVDCSTVHPDVTNEIAARLGDRGAVFASMPVLGSPAVATAGQLICLLSGPATVVDTIKPYTAGIIARAVIEFRDKPAGKADLLKLIANMFILNVNEIIAEGLTFAEKASIEPAKLQELLTSLFGGVYATYAERMVGGSYLKEEPQVPVEMALKDAYHALEVAEEVNCSLPSLTLIEENLQALKTQRGPKADSSGVYGVSRMKNGLEFENITL